MNKLHQKNKESFQNPKKSSLIIFKNGFKTIRRIVPLDTAYRASRNGVSSTAVRWRAKVLAFLPLRPRRLPAPTGKASRFLRLTYPFPLFLKPRVTIRCSPVLPLDLTMTYSVIWLFFGFSFVCSSKSAYLCNLKW